MKNILHQSSLFLFFSLIFNVLSAQIIYVDGTAAGADNGTSWTDAYVSLRLAMDNAPINAEIWVKEGSYRPDYNSNDRGFTFQPKYGQKILGGFPVDNPNPTLMDRDPVVYPTIMTGEIGNPSDLTDNSIHVIRFLSLGEMELDGFIIEKGYANDADNYWWGENGGGLVVDNFNTGLALPPPVKVKDCIFRNNYAGGSGGGVFVVASNNGTPTKFETIFENCTFQDNEAAIGGAVRNFSAYEDNFGEATYTNCDFLNNTATSGGAVQNDGGSGGRSQNTFTGCTFISNMATDTGGAMDDFSAFGGECSTELLNCIFNQNKAVEDAGAYVLNSFDGTMAGLISNCQFLNNGDETAMQPASGSGAIYMTTSNTGASISTTLENNTFNNNYSAGHGGAININVRAGATCTSSITGGEFRNNKSGNSGGAIYQWSDQADNSPNYENVGFYENISLNNGGAFCYSGAYETGTSMSSNFNDCTFVLNYAEEGGGGVALFGGNAVDCQATFTDCSFLGNSSNNEGGAVFNAGWDKEEGQPVFSPSFTTCIFQFNTASYAAGVYNGGQNSTGFGLCEPSFSQSLFHNNTASLEGSEVYNEGGNGSVGGNFTNCIFLRDDTDAAASMIVNARNGASGNVYTYYNYCTVYSTVSNTLVTNISAFPNVYNTIIWGTGTEAMNDIASTPSVYSSDIRNTDVYYPNSSNNNFNIDPLLAWDGTDYMPRCSSPILNLGYGTSPLITAPTKDYYNRVRTTNNQPDMGAVEFHIADDYFTQIVGETGPMTAIADYEFYYFDLDDSPDTWTYYLDCDAIAPGRNLLLLGIGKNGNTLGTIANGTLSVEVFGDDTSPAVDLSAADYVTNPTGYFAMNRYWSVDNDIAPTNPYLNIRQFYTDASVAQIIAATDLTVEEDMRFFKITDAEPHDLCVLNCGGTFDEYTYSDFQGSLTQWKNDYTIGGTGTGLKYSEYAVTGFSGGGSGSGGNGGGALPLQLLNFTGEAKPSFNQVGWTTADEKAVDYFQVERSKNGQTNWEILGKISSKGKPNTTQDYTFLDHQFLAKAFYRLTIIEQSGKESLSPSIFIEREQESAIWSVFPNPAQQQFNIKINNTKKGTAVISISDILGKNIKEQAQVLAGGETTIAVDCDDWEAGVYFITIKMNGQRHTKKLMLQ